MENPDVSRAIWRKSSRSGQNGNCVEVADLQPAIAVRDSKSPGTGYLTFTPTAWAAFVTKIQDGQLDLS